MRKYKSLQLIIAITAFAVIGGFAALQLVNAATGTIYIADRSGKTTTVQQGNEFDIDVVIDPGTTIDGVQATVNYDPAKLQFVSNTANGISAFNAPLQYSQTNGAVTNVRGDLENGVSANKSLITRIRFKALAGSGSTNLTFSNANATANGAYVNPANVSATIAFSTPVTPTPTPPTPTPPSPTPTPTPKPSPSPTPTPKPSPSPSPTPKPSPSPSPTSQTPSPSPTPSPTPTPTTTGSTAKQVSVTQQTAQFTKAVITLKSTKPTQVYIKYGVGTDLSISTSYTEFATEHKVALDSRLLVPGETYSYVVVSKDQDGNVEESSRQTIRTKGFTIRLSVMDQNKKPLKNYAVTLHSSPMQGKTDANGAVSFNDVSPGDHQLQAQIDGKAASQLVRVTNDITTNGDIQTAAVQTASVVFTTANKSSLPLPIIIFTLLGLLLIAAIVFIFKRRNRNEYLTAPIDQTPAQPYSTTPTGFEQPGYTYPAQQQPQQPSLPAQQYPQQPQPPVNNGVDVNGTPYPAPPQPGTTISPNANNRKDQE